MRINALLPISSIVILTGVLFFMGIKEDEASILRRNVSNNVLVPKSSEDPMDVARFARVVTWDPHRDAGTHAIRSEAFPEKDLFPAKDILPDAHGHYLLPVSADGLGCIGLQWLNRRTVSSLGIQFMVATRIPAAKAVRVQGWFGESTWQGKWETLKGSFTTEGNQLIFHVSPDTKLYFTQKIRWIFPVSIQPVVIRALSAFTSSTWDTTTLVIESEHAAKNTEGEFTVYNGALVGVGTDGMPKQWTLSHPLRVKIKYSLPSPAKSDPTILRFHLPAGSFSVAVNDVLENKCVYVPEYGLFIKRDSVKIDLADYKKEIAHHKTILQQVNEMPEQTFAKAMVKTNHTIQRNGPVMLSLACDNVKFLVQRSGAVQFETSDHATGGFFVTTGEMRPLFGTGPDQNLTRHLERGWMPIPIITVEKNGIIYTQRTFVAPLDSPGANPDRLNRPSVCVVELTAENNMDHISDAALSLAFFENIKVKGFARLSPSDKGYWVQKQDGTKIALIDTTGAGSLLANSDSGKVAFQGKLPPGAIAHYVVYFPGVDQRVAKMTSFPDPGVFLSKAKDYWRAMVKPAMHVAVPDSHLQNTILSSQVRCLIDSRNEGNGTRIAPWTSAMDYGTIGSESNSVIRGMDFMGHAEFARRSLDYFIHRYNPSGFLTTGYTTFATGWNLWTLGEHFQLYRDLDWFKSVAPVVARAGEWVIRQMEKTKQFDPAGQPVPEYGLMPPGVTADWNVFGYHFLMDAYYYAGLQAAGKCLEQNHYPEGKKIIENAVELKNNLLHAYHWIQSQAPVLPLRNGTWVIPYPAQLLFPGKIGDFFPGQDGGRSWAYDIELGAHHLVPAKVLNANSREVTDMINQMEDVQFLSEGFLDYPAAMSQKDWFDLGGFSKVQPYYTRIAEIYALRNDVKPFIRSYFNTIAAMLNPETLTIWEHFHASGAPDKTHETGYFLYQTRIMLVMEHGDELWLAPFVPRNWLKDGLTVAVENAPTRFGKVSYRVQSHVARGYIQATIDAPTRQDVKGGIVLRLPHPEGKPIRSVTINGKKTKQFDPVKGTVSFDLESDRTLAIIAKY